jgi:hypothetical protein
MRAASAIFWTSVHAAVAGKLARSASAWIACTFFSFGVGKVISGISSSLFFE